MHTFGFFIVEDLKYLNRLGRSVRPVKMRRTSTHGPKPANIQVGVKNGPDRLARCVADAACIK